MDKLVSIIVPAYNSEATIIETIQSVINQTYPHVEIIIVNDGSTDNTLEIVTDFIASFANVRLYSKKNQGLPATRNYGFERSLGHYLVFLDSDDLLDKTYVAECVKRFEENSNLSLVYSQTMFFERINELYELPDFTLEVMLTQNCITATAMIKSSAFSEVGMYDENIKFGEDWELWIRLLSKYPHVYKIEKPLFFYRRRNSQDSMTDLKNKENVSEISTLYIYSKHYALYQEYGYSINKLLLGQMEVLRYKNKYYNVWYRKLFYLIKSFFRKKNTN